MESFRSTDDPQQYPYNTKESRMGDARARNIGAAVGE